MSSIKISDLCASKSNLSVDSESFLDELNESDLATIKGGMRMPDFLMAAWVRWILWVEGLEHH